MEKQVNTSDNDNVYYISTNSPVGNEVTCDSSTSRTTLYWYAEPGKDVALVPLGSIVNQEYAQFYVNFQGTTVTIYTKVGGTNYYINKNNQSISNYINTSSGLVNVYSSFNILVNKAGSTTDLVPISSMTTATAYISIVDTPLNYYLLNYDKNSFGNFNSNNYVFVDELTPGFNPITTGKNNVSCNYLFTFTPVNTSSYSVLATTSSQQPETLMFLISYFKNNIALQASRALCYNRNFSIYCTPKSDILISAIGRTSSTVESSFDHSYRVKIRQNSGFLRKKCTQGNPKLSIYNLNDNYIIIKLCDTYFLLTNEVNPSCNKISHMTKRFESFVDTHNV